MSPHSVVRGNIQTMRTGSFIKADDTPLLVRTALRVIEGYNKWDIEAIMAPRAASCTQRVHPVRLGRPFLNNKEYREWFASIQHAFHHFEVEVLDLVEDQAHNKVAVHAKSRAQTAIGPYQTEYMIVIQMTDEQDEALSIKEFVDSGYVEEFHARLKMAAIRS